MLLVIQSDVAHSDRRMTLKYGGFNGDRLGTAASTGQILRNSSQSISPPHSYSIANNSQTDTLFHKYSQFSSSNIAPKRSEDEGQTESQLRELLEKVRNAIRHFAPRSRIVDNHF